MVLNPHRTVFLWFDENFMVIKFFKDFMVFLSFPLVPYPGAPMALLNYTYCS